MRQLTHSASLLVALLVTCTMAIGQTPGFKPLPIGGRRTADQQATKAQVSLLADRTGLVPGRTAHLAIVFDVADEWHTYWRHHGQGAGMPPTFTWQLPEGITAGPVQFPPPKRYVDATGDASFILEGRAVLLVPLAVAETVAPGQEAELRLKARWLVCKDMCAIEQKELVLTLPVVADAEQAKPDNEDVFAWARGRMPLPMEQAKHLKRLWAAADVDKVKPGSRFNVAVVLDVEDEHHVNSHEPLDAGLIRTDLFSDRTNGLYIEAPIFPAGRIKEAGGEKMSLYSGRVVLVLPVEADGVLETEQLRLGGVVTYQACSDATLMCFPPTAAEWELILPVAGEGEQVSPAHAELFTTGPAGVGFTLDGDIRPSTQHEQHSLVVWLFLAFLAGLLMNVTPCVLPVISIKVLSFVQQASESPAKVLKLGVAFAVGMVLVFNILAILATGVGLAWGQHFQSPVFTIALSSIVFAFSLSLFGVFTLGVPTSVGNLAVRTEGEGYGGSIAKGMFATVMGTPCVGPLLGPVLVWSASQPAIVVFLVFNTIGVGMALPYVLLTANPGWLRFVPKPGPWLTVFKQAMAFLLLGMVAYLLKIVQAQLGGQALWVTLAFFVCLALACWIVGMWVTPLASVRQRRLAMLISLAVVAGSAWGFFHRGFEPTAQASATERAGKASLPWVDFSLERLTELTASGKTVFLDVTAAWCSNCKVNMAFVFNTPEMLDAVTKHDVVPMLADWTNPDEEIRQLMDRLAPGASVPLCAVFPAGRPNEPIVMLGLVTKPQVIGAIERSSQGDR